MALADVVNEVIDRIVLMQKDVVSDSASTKWWAFWGNEFPYWTNRIASLRNDQEDLWELEINMRLTVAHESQLTIGSSVAQEAVWTYVPDVMEYFEQYRQLDMPGEPALEFIAPSGVSILCPTGVDLFRTERPITTTMFVDFFLTVPIQILGAY